MMATPFDPPTMEALGTVFFYRIAYVYSGDDRAATGTHETRTADSDAALGRDDE